MNYVERHFGDWAKDTAHLSMLEDGAYNRLCDVYYVREGALPDDLTACCRLVRAVSKPERDAVRSVLAEFFERTANGWLHKRCEVEIERYRIKSGKATASANARWKGTSGRNSGGISDGTSERIAQAMPHARADARAPTPQAPNTKHQTPIPGSQPKVASLGRASASPPTPRAARKAPPDFAIGDDLRAWALEFAPTVDLEAETAAFKDHTFKTAIDDWPATWRNWIRKSVAFAPRNGAKPHQSDAERSAEARRLLGFDKPAGTQEIIDA